MITDPIVREQAYQYFLEEAPELLQAIEQELFSLNDDSLEKNQRALKVNRLMRATHTLKGGSANVGLETIKTIAHSLEDLYKALYNPELEIDSQLQTLLFESYECLRLPLTAELTKTDIDHSEILNRAADILARLQEKLGDYLTDIDAFPSSEELGLDVVESFFKEIVPERLQLLVHALDSSEVTEIAKILHSQAEVFFGLAESLKLPGLEAIASNILIALERYPERAKEIAEVALANLQQARQQVLEGDRERGGEPSLALLSLSNPDSNEVWQEGEVVIVDPVSEESFEDKASEWMYEIWGREIDSAKIDGENRVEHTRKQEPILSEVFPTQNVSRQTKSGKETSVFHTVRIELEALNRFNNSMGELLIDQNNSLLKYNNIHELVENLVEKLDKTDRILDSIEELFQETSILAKNQPELTRHRQANNIASAAIDLLSSARNNNLESIEIAEKIGTFNQQSHRNIQKQQKILLDMRDELIATRMSPLERVFNRFPPAIEQLAKARGKKIDLRIIGGQTLIDKAIEDKLYDPLLHLVRNAFDHGIESPDVRLQSGKPETGTIELRAYYQGSQTIVEVRDDGNGLDFEKIRKRAIELNLIPARSADKISESRLLEFLFQPGFSTATKVSDLSGRGVGLDVVRSQIESVKGTIEINSVPNEGTTFSLQIPITLTIAKLMLCEASGIVYALLIDAIERIILPTTEQIQIYKGQKLLRWESDSQSNLVPVRKLAEAIEYSRLPKGKISQIKLEADRSDNPILLLRHHSRLLGLEVDRVLGEQELVIRPLGSAIAAPSYIYGCSISSNSSLILVIDPIALIEETQRSKTYETQRAYLSNSLAQVLPTARIIPQLPPAASNITRALPTILVVDDSSSLRKTIKLSLQKINCQVLEAENGLQALEKLRESKNVSLVICDLEMPHMNGFQFLKTVRQNSQFASLPIAIVTSRNNEKFRQLAGELQASAYFTKPYREEDLLDTLLTLLDLNYPPLANL